jgi:hypothetical protein
MPNVLLAAAGRRRSPAPFTPRAGRTYRPMGRGGGARPDSQTVLRAPDH